MVIGLAANVAVLVVALVAALVVDRDENHRRRAGRLALVSLVLVVTVVPLAAAVRRVLVGERTGARDLGDAWNWGLVLVASLSVAAVVHRWSTWRRPIPVVVEAPRRLQLEKSDA